MQKHFQKFLELQKNGLFDQPKFDNSLTQNLLILISYLNCLEWHVSHYDVT